MTGRGLLLGQLPGSHPTACRAQIRVSVQPAKPDDVSATKSKGPIRSRGVGSVLNVVAHPCGRCGPCTPSSCAAEIESRLLDPLDLIVDGSTPLDLVHTQRVNRHLLLQPEAVEGTLGVHLQVGGQVWRRQGALRFTGESARRPALSIAMNDACERPRTMSSSTSSPILSLPRGLAVAAAGSPPPITGAANSGLHEVLLFEHWLTTSSCGYALSLISSSNRRTVQGCSAASSMPDTRILASCPLAGVQPAIFGAMVGGVRRAN